MPATDKFFAINIRKYLALGDDQEAGEPALVKLLSGFSCPKNPVFGIGFLKKKCNRVHKNGKITRAAGIRKSLERRLLNWLG